MDFGNILIILVLVLLGVVIFLLLGQKNKKEDNSQTNEINQLKESLNNSISTMTTSFNSLSKDVTRDMAQTMTKVEEKIDVFNKQVEEINQSQTDFSRILAGVKQYGGLSEFSLANLLEDLLPASHYIANAKMKPEETRDHVEFAIKLQNNVLCPIDSHWPIEKYKAVDEAFQNNDKESLNDARAALASAFKAKSKAVNDKYINPPLSTDFAIVYVPIEGLYAELSSYRDPKTKELLLEELRKKYKVTIAGPNTLCAIIQAYHLGFQTLRVQKHATQIHEDLKTITSRFGKHFDNIKVLRKKLEEAMKVTDDFGRDARSISRTLENIKDPEQVELASKNQNIEKFPEPNKKINN